MIAIFERRWLDPLRCGESSHKSSQMKFAANFCWAQKMADRQNDMPNALLYHTHTHAREICTYLHRKIFVFFHFHLNSGLSFVLTTAAVHYCHCQFQLLKNLTSNQQLMLLSCTQFIFVSFSPIFSCCFSVVRQFFLLSATLWQSEYIWTIPWLSHKCLVNGKLYTKLLNNNRIYSFIGRVCVVFSSSNGFCNKRVGRRILNSILWKCRL